MSPSCHFPPAPSPVPMSSLLADGFVAYFKPKTKFGLSYISLWCSHLRMYLPLLPVLGLSQLSWRITDPLVLRATSSTLPLGHPSAWRYCSHPCFSLLCLCLSLLTTTPSWAAGGNFLLPTPGFCGTIFCWFYLSLSHHFLVPFKVSTSPCSSICGSPVLFLAPAVLISLSSDVWCSFHSSL